MSLELLTHSKSYRKPSALVDPTDSLTTYFDTTRGYRTPDIDAWGKRYQQLKEIEATHKKYNDLETPIIKNEIIQGARRLIRILDAQGLPSPTCMTGTVDATICFEWHNWDNSGKSMTIDVLGYDQIERFFYTEDGKPQIAIESF